MTTKRITKKNEVYELFIKHQEEETADDSQSTILLENTKVVINWTITY